MRAVVLVGGFGTRLRPLTLSVPKQMLPVGQVTMLEQVVARLGRAGVTEVVLSLGYRPDVFLEAFPDGRCAGVPLVYAEEPEPLDTAGAIAFAARFAGIDDTFLALNGDVITDLDLAELWQTHLRHGGEATIALTPVEDPSRYGVVPTDDDGRVLDFVEKPDPGTAPSNWINAGTYVLEPSVLDRIPEGQRLSIERVVFPALVADGTIYAMKSDAYWLDAGTISTYLSANLDLLEGAAHNGSSHSGPKLLAVADDAVIDLAATVSASVVGAGVRIGADSRVSSSVIIAGAVIGSNVTIEGSVIGGRAIVESGAVITNSSVVGFDQIVGAGDQLDGMFVPAREEWS